MISVWFYCSDRIWGIILKIPWQYVDTYHNESLLMAFFLQWLKNVIHFQSCRVNCVILGGKLLQQTTCLNKLIVIIFENKSVVSLSKEEPEAFPHKVSFQGFLQLTRAWYQKEVTSILTLSHFGVMMFLPFNQNLNSKLNVTKSSSSCLPYFGFKTHVL